IIGALNEPEANLVRVMPWFFSLLMVYRVFTGIGWEYGQYVSNEELCMCSGNTDSIVNLCGGEITISVLLHFNSQPAVDFIFHKESE
ncbi:MAG: hypothetical protein ACI4A3_02145, partial [Lachnospiraceae bacterium]